MKKIFFPLLILALLFGGNTMTLPTYGDTPDYGKTLASSPTIQSYDTGEDTTRLLMGGGSNSRSGRWLWATGFESGAGEILFDTGTAEELDTVNPYMGRACIRLFPAAVVDDYGAISKSLFSPAIPGTLNNRFGIEFMVSFDSIQAPGQSQLHIMAFAPSLNTANNIEPDIYVNITAPGAASLYYVNNAGASVLFGDVNNYIVNNQPKLYHYVKMIYDINKAEYVRFIFDNRTFDLSGIPTPISPGTLPRIKSLITFDNKTALTLPVARIDNLIITGDEP